MCAFQVPYRLLPKYHKRLLTNACLQTRLVRELEKKFSGRIVVIIAQRRILRKSLDTFRRAGISIVSKRAQCTEHTGGSAVHRADAEGQLHLHDGRTI